MRFSTITQFFIVIISILALNISTISAEEETRLQFTPLVKVKLTHTVADKNTHLSSSSSPKVLTEDKKMYTLGLGTTLHINDNLNIDAACGLPLLNGEIIQMENLSIEAMVTMQF